MDVHFSSKTNEWFTPDHVFNQLNDRFNFTLDSAATAKNTKCEKFYAEHDDGLSKCWSNETVWLNPPYGRQIKNCVKKAKNEAQKGATVVMLIPARTETSYWHEYIFPHASEILFVDGRIKFGGSPHNAPFPSAVVIFSASKHQKISTIAFKGGE